MGRAPKLLKLILTVGFLTNAPIALSGNDPLPCEVPNRVEATVGDARAELRLAGRVKTEPLGLLPEGIRTSEEAYHRLLLAKVPSDEAASIVLARMALFHQHLVDPKNIPDLLSVATQKIAPHAVVPKPYLTHTHHGQVAIEGAEALVDGNMIRYPRVEFPKISIDTSASAYLQKATGQKLNPLLDSENKAVHGGFRAIFECAPPEKCLYKVFDPQTAVAKLRKKFPEVTEELLARRLLPTLQRDAAIEGALRDLLKRAGDPPPFRLAHSETIAPGIVKMERIESESMFDLIDRRSPLLRKCAKELQAFERSVARLNAAILVAQKQRYGANVGLGWIPVGIDLNSTNVHMGPDCLPVLIDW